MAKKYNPEEFHSGEAIKRLEKKLGLERGQLSYKLGITSKYLSELKKKDTDIGIKSWMRWCDSLDCDIDYILGLQELPKKKDTDISAATGLSNNAISKLYTDLQKHQFRSAVFPTSEDVEVSEDHLKRIADSVKGVGVDISTADIINALLVDNSIGMELKNAMFQYITESLVCRLLEKTAINAIEHYNSANERPVDFRYALACAEDAYSLIRSFTAISSLTAFGKMQTGIHNEFETFYEQMKKLNFSQGESKVFYNYLLSKNRLDGIKSNCYSLLFRFLDKVAENGKLTYYDNFLGSESGLSESTLPTRTDEDYNRTIKELVDSYNQAEKDKSYLAERVRELEKELKELKSVNK